jgi:hypothetical protein
MANLLSENLPVSVLNFSNQRQVLAAAADPDSMSPNLAMHV